MFLRHCAFARVAIGLVLPVGGLAAAQLSGPAGSHVAWHATRHHACATAGEAARSAGQCATLATTAVPRRTVSRHPHRTAQH